MSLTAAELIQVMEKAKELGLTSFKSGDLELTLAQQVQQIPQVSAPKTEVPELKPEEIINPLSVLDDMDEDEIKYWATPYYDEIQAKKEAQRQLAKEQIEVK